MNRPLETGFPVSTSLVAEYGQIARSDRRPQRTKPLMRKYEVAYLAPNSDGMTVTRIAPAMLMFETAFMALARGTLIATPRGQIAIEDLVPGMMVSSPDDAPQTILWKGSTTIVPGAPGQSAASAALVRLAPDALGFQKPTQDLLLGCGARLCRNGAEAYSVTPQTLLDEEAAISVRPPSPVRVFHIATRIHSTIIANGIELESFHPGRTFDRTLRSEIRQSYLSLFPHIRSLDDFGPARFLRADPDVDTAEITAPLY